MSKQEELRVIITETRKKVKGHAEQLASVGSAEDETYIANLEREVRELKRYIKKYKKIA